MKTELTTFKALKGMPRREMLKRALVGTASIAVADKLRPHADRYINEKVPLWLGAEKRHELLMGFHRHDQGTFARPIIDAIDSARATGRPFHVFFRETALMPRAEFNKFVMAVESNSESFRKTYALLREQGKTEAEAKKELIMEYNKKYANASEFNAVLETELALRKIPIVPIEAFSTEEVVLLSEKHAVFEAEDRNVAMLKAQNAPLLAVQKAEMHSGAGLQVTNARNSRIKEQLPFLFDEVKRLFPALAKEPQLRAVGTLGIAHRNVFASFDGEKAKIHVEEMPHAEKYSIFQHVARNAMPFRVPNEKDACRKALAPYIDGNLKVLSETGKEYLAKKAFRSALSLTQEEFAKLSSATEKMNRNGRIRYIMNYLLGEQYY